MSHMRSEGVMDSTGDLAAEVVGTVVHDETAFRTKLYFSSWSGVRAGFFGMTDLGDWWGKGVLRIAGAGFSDAVEVGGGSSWALSCGPDFVVMTADEGAVEAIFCSVGGGTAC